MLATKSTLIPFKEWHLVRSVRFGDKPISQTDANALRDYP